MRVACVAAKSAVLAVWLKLINTEIPSAPCKPDALPGKVLLLCLDRSRPVHSLLARPPTTSTAAPTLDGLHCVQCVVAEGSVVEVLLAKSSLVGVGPDTVMMTW